MNKVNPKKLLPAPVSKKQASLSQKMLVPASRVTTKEYARVDDSTSTPQQKELNQQTIKLKTKFISLTKLFGEKTSLEKKKNKQKRIEAEQERRAKREEETESSNTKFNFGSKLPKLNLPRTGFLDTIKRFLLYGLLGFAIDKFGPVIPALMGMLTKLKPAFEFFKDVTSGIIGGIVNFIDTSYKAYDFVKGKVQDIIGPDRSEDFDNFTKGLKGVINGTLIVAAAILGLGGARGPLGKLGVDRGKLGAALGAAAGVGVYASRYTFRTVKDTAPAFQTRLSNMLLRGSMGLPAAKELPTRELLKSPAFAVATRKPKEIAKTIVVGADEVNTLRKAGVGTLTRPEQDEINSVKRKIGKRLGLTDRQISNAFVFRDLTPPKKPKTISSTKILGQTFSSEIARIKKTFMKLGYQPTDLIKIANDVNGQDYFTRKAAYDILVKKGKADRVFNIPSLESILPRPADRVAKVAEPTTFEKYIRKMQESGRSVDPMLTGAAGDRAAQRAGALPAEELVGGPPKVTRPVDKVTRPTVDPTLSRTPSKLRGFAGGLRGLSKGPLKALIGPFIGGIVDFVVSMLFGDPIGEAAAGAVGAAVLGAVGGFLGNLILPVGGGFIGATLGGFGGDYLFREIYKNLFNVRQGKELGLDSPDSSKRTAPARAIMPSEREIGRLGFSPEVTGRYGDKRTTGTHGGTDIAAPSGTPLVPVTDGVIIDYGDLGRSDDKRGDPNGWGNFIVYKDANGYYHLYGHLSSIIKKSGRVRSGETIATVGSTGRSSGPHLHWELGTGWSGGMIEGKMDPLSFYNVSAPFGMFKKQASLGKTTANVASGLSDTTDYEEQQVAFLQTIIERVQTPVPAGGGTMVLNSNNTPSIFAPALVG